MRHSAGAACFLDVEVVARRDLSLQGKVATTTTWILIRARGFVGWRSGGHEEIGPWMMRGLYYQASRYFGGIQDAETEGFCEQSAPIPSRTENSSP